LNANRFFFFRTEVETKMVYSSSADPDIALTMAALNDNIVTFDLADDLAALAP